jgi:hypothetical protein
MKVTLRRTTDLARSCFLGQTRCEQGKIAFRLCEGVCPRVVIGGRGHSSRGAIETA